MINSLIKALSGVRGVRIHGLEIVLNWDRDRPLVSELFREFNRVPDDGVRLVIAIDGAQRLSGPAGVKVWNAVAHAYDFLNNLLFIISGSEMGVLGSILSNPESPLFGRAYAEVTTRKPTVTNPWSSCGVDFPRLVLRLINVSLRVLRIGLMGLLAG